MTASTTPPTGLINNSNENNNYFLNSDYRSHLSERFKRFHKEFSPDVTRFDANSRSYDPSNSMACVERYYGKFDIRTRTFEYEKFGMETYVGRYPKYGLYSYEMEICDLLNLLQIVEEN